MVFLVHIIQGYSVSNKYISNFIFTTRYGVIVFFVISAYTIYMSLDRSAKFNLKAYITRRIFRIIPMYYLILIFAFIIGGSQIYLPIFNLPNDLYNLFMNLSFLNLFDIRYRQTLINVSWTIPVELFFYAAIPFAHQYISKAPIRIVNILLVSFLISAFSHFAYLRFYPDALRYYAQHWSVLFYFFTYAVGIGAYLVVKCFKPNFSSLHLIILLLIYLAFSITIDNDDNTYNTIFVSVWSSLLIIFTSSRNLLTRILFENKFALLIGDISYSFYLIHFFFIEYFASFGFDFYTKTILVFLLTSILSYITHILIEQPFIKIGKRLSAKLSTQDSK